LYNQKKTNIIKKISVFLVTAIFVIAFTSCTGAKKTEVPAEQPVKADTIAAAVTPPPAATDSVAPTKSPADMLKDFQAYAKAYGEAFNNIAKDPAKYSDLAGQSQKRVSAMEQIKDQLNPKQLQDYKKACDIIINVNKGGKK
jgi:hypothetical protein